MPQTLPFPEPLTPSPSRWAGWGLASFAAVTLGALLAPLALLWPRGVHEGRGAWRRRRLVSAVTAAFVPLLAVDPQVVWAVHEEALAYQAMAVAGLGVQPAYPGARIDYTYDANGNLLSATTVRGDLVTIQTYTFDAENRLVVCASGSADAPLALTAYTYDFDGIRSSKSVGGQFTRYTTDKNRDYAQVLEERDADGVVQVRYAYGHDLISQTRDPQGGPQPTSFYHYDGQLSTRQLTDGTLASPTYGQVTDSYTYDAFGNQLYATGSTANAYRYTGEQLDANTGFYYLRARYYDQATGRFASRDPFCGVPSDPRSLHTYTYAHADPINGRDPTGLFTLIEVTVATAIMGAIAGALLGASAGVKRTGSLLSGTTIKYMVIGLLGGAALGALIGSAVYIASIAPSAIAGILRTGLTKLWSKLDARHSRSALAALTGFALGLVVGLLDPDLFVSIASVGTTVAVLLTDAVFRGAAVERRPIAQVVGPYFIKYGKVIIQKYAQATTFIALAFAVGFTAGHFSGAAIRRFYDRF